MQRDLRREGARPPASDAPEPPRAPGDPFRDLDALAQAELVQRKEVSPRELAEAAIARIEALQPELRAVVEPRFESALERASGEIPKGPFRGVPALLKTTMLWQGAKVSFGCRFFREHVAGSSHEVVKRMERAGFVLLGLTNASEFGLLPLTESRLHGPTPNPWQPAHSPGGSSGGSAAAVAARLVPLAQGSDGGGSIRIPASACGVFGLKVSRGRNPEAPAPDALGLSVVSCLSRSVRDSSAFLDAISGPQPGDRWWVAAPERPYREEVGAPPGRLRIAVSTADFLGQAAHPDCAAAVEATARLCEELGHDVEEAGPGLDGRAFSEAFVLMWAVNAAKVIGLVTRAIGRPPDRELFEPWTWALADFQARRTPSDLLAAMDTVQREAYKLAAFHERFDLLLTPALGAPPVRTGEIDQERPFEELVETLTRYVAFTPLANATGVPAMSVPLAWNGDGLPIGSHFQARHGAEATLLRLAAQLEEARPWSGRRPALGA